MLEHICDNDVIELPALQPPWPVRIIEIELMNLVAEFS
jgi:hypothetical protein